MSILEPTRFVWLYPIRGEPYVGTTDATGMRLFFDNPNAARIEYQYHPDHDVYLVFEGGDGARGYRFGPDGTYMVTLYPEGMGSAQPADETGTYTEK